MGSDPAEGKSVAGVGLGFGPHRSASSPLCSVCFEDVSDSAFRGTARLGCGHEFHLDCIGSTFNCKGLMQCPNCRNIEEGNWLFSTGASLEFPDDDWTVEHTFADAGFSELPGYICPFNRSTSVPLSSEEDEFDISIASPIHRPQSLSSSNSQVSTESFFSASTFNQWGSMLDPISSPSSRTQRVGSDIHPGMAYMQPFVIAQGASSGANNAASPSRIPHYTGVPQGHARPENHPLYQSHQRQSPQGTAPPHMRRSGRRRRMTPLAPPPRPEFSLFSPATSVTGMNPQDVDADRRHYSYALEIDHLAHYSIPIDRDFPWWRPNPFADGSLGEHSAFWAQHDLTRTSSRSHGPYHPRLHPFT